MPMFRKTHEALATSWLLSATPSFNAISFSDGVTCHALVNMSVFHEIWLRVRNGLRFPILLGPGVGSFLTAKLLSLGLRLVIPEEVKEIAAIAAGIRMNPPRHFFNNN